MLAQPDGYIIFKFSVRNVVIEVAFPATKLLIRGKKYATNKIREMRGAIVII